MTEVWLESNNVESPAVQRPTLGPEPSLQKPGLVCAPLLQVQVDHTLWTLVDPGLHQDTPLNSAAVCSEFRLTQRHNLMLQDRADLDLLQLLLITDQKSESPALACMLTT